MEKTISPTNQNFHRYEQAFQILEGNGVQMISTNEAMVQSQNSSKKYRVNILEKTCECPDHQFRNVECKHLKATKQLPVQEKIFAKFCENNLADKSLLLEWS